MTPSQTFHDHIQELRRRLLWVILAIGISAGISYGLHKPLVRVLQHPLGSPLFYTSPAGSFNFIVKLSMVIGIFIALPVTVYQILAFIRPALPNQLKKGRTIKVIIASFLLACAGVAFGFFLMIPMSLHFFAGYASDQIRPLISASEYLSYVLNNLMVFALVFQIPLLILFINWIWPIKPGKLLRYQRHVIVGSFAIAVILPFTYDPISQFIVAIPIVVLFYVSVILLWIVNRKTKAKPEVATVIEPSKPLTPVVPAFIAAVPVLPQIPQPQMATVVQRPALRPLRTTDGIIRQSAGSRNQTPAYVPRPIPRPAPRPTLELPTEGLKPGLSLDGLLPT